MANTRSLYSVIKATAGLILPTGAGAGKIWTSDSEGKGSWEADPKKKFVVEHAWVIEGAVSTGRRPGFFVKLGEGNEKKIIGVECNIETGTSAEIELLKNGSALTSYTAIKAEK